MDFKIGQTIIEEHTTWDFIPTLLTSPTRSRKFLTVSNRKDASLAYGRQHLKANIEVSDRVTLTEKSGRPITAHFKLLTCLYQL